MRTFLLCSLCLGAAATAFFVRGGGAGPAPLVEARPGDLTGDLTDEVHGPGPAPVDVFHPDRLKREEREPKPSYGGRVVVHLGSMPPSLCFPIENSTNTRNILYEVHETLLRLDWETWERLPSLARERIVEDEEGTVYRYKLREDVLWHPAEGYGEQRLDARDVAFSFSVYANPDVRCDEKRYQFEDLTCEVLGTHDVRFTYPEPHFRGDESVGGMTILPSHIYDLSDPDNPAHDPDATAQEQARHINENPHNRLWIGLGPYRVVEFAEGHVEAQRFEGYFDKSRGGYLDRIRWRRIGDAAAFQALLEREIDFTARLGSEDYFTRATEEPFTKSYYRGYYATGVYGAIAWNLHRPQLADKRVRQAIAHCFDFESFRRTQYKGLATQVTGPLPLYSLSYDRDVEPYPHDPKRAEGLLDEAGWYDRDGDGVRDKDGEPLRIEFLSPAGSASSRTLGLKLQEDLAAVGIELALRDLDFAAWRERQRQREFDGTPMGWYPPLEPDPAQLWHSSGGALGAESSNYTGLQDAEVDALIERIHAERDAAARAQLWHQLHRRLYDLQPFLFLYNVPTRFAMSRELFGFQAVKIEPGYVIRRWYYTE
jgi:ABC-type transport system substrate-binding protein